MTAFDAVIFDWSGTLVHDPPLRERVLAAGARLGRPDSPEMDRICAALNRHEHDPDVAAAQLRADTSSNRYFAAEALHFQRAGVDDELAESLLHVDEYSGFRPLYPDALPTLGKLKELALARLELPAHRVLMVGDRSTHDGAAAECGMVTLLLPRLSAFGRRGLSLVENMVRG